MPKPRTIVYWISTGWLALGMVSTGMVQLIGSSDDVADIVRLGYPAYILPILGVWKLLGTVAVLLPRYPLVKEWAYAGFVFAMTGAMVSRMASGEPATAVLPPLLLLALTVTSWYTRPASRRMP